jgi:H+/Cl- antiporter ClcA
MSNKSKKYKKQKKKNIPWLLLALGGVLVVIAGLFFARQNGDGGGTPAVAVDQQKIDYGYVPFGNNKTFAIKVTNNGTGTLRFKDKPYVEVLEGC